MWKREWVTPNSLQVTGANKLIPSIYLSKERKNEMNVVKDVNGTVVWCLASKITEDMTTKRNAVLSGAFVDWNADPILRMPGDDLFFPGRLANGNPVWVSRSLAYHF